MKDFNNIAKMQKCGGDSKLYYSFKYAVLKQKGGIK